MYALVINENNDISIYLSIYLYLRTLPLLEICRLHLISTFLPLFDREGHVCSENLIPSNEEGLRKVVMEALELMMSVVKRWVVSEQKLGWTPREPQPAVDVDRPNRREREEI